jgi:hypothetical protein
VCLCQSSFLHPRTLYIGFRKAKLKKSLKKKASDCNL